MIKRHTFNISLKATREAILNRTVEHKEGRLHTFQNASAVFDLLAIALVKRAQFHKLADVSTMSIYDCVYFNLD